MGVASYISGHRRSIGIHMHMQDSGVVCRAVLLRKGGSTISVEKSLERNSLEELISELPKWTPTYFTTSGKGELTQVLSGRTQLSHRDFVRQMFAQVHPDDIIVQSETYHDVVLVSCARKERIIESLSMLKEASVSVVTHAFLNQTLLRLGQTLSLGEISTPEGFIDLTDHTISLLPPTEVPDVFEFGSEQIESKFIGSLAAAMQHFTIEQTSDENLPMLDTAKEDLHYRTLLTRFGLAGVAGLFLIVAANLFLFGQLRKEEGQLKASHALHQGSLAQIQQLEQLKESKKLLISKTGAQQPQASTRMADEIGRGIPESVTLTKLQILPVAKRIRPEKPISFQGNTIQLEGTCRNTSDLHQWLGALRDLEFVSSAELGGYLKDRTGKQSFDLKIEIAS